MFLAVCHYVFISFLNIFYLIYFKDLNARVLFLFFLNEVRLESVLV